MKIECVITFSYPRQYIWSHFFSFPIDAKKFIHRIDLKLTYLFTSHSPLLLLYNIVTQFFSKYLLIDCYLFVFLNYQALMGTRYVPTGIETGNIHRMWSINKRITITFKKWHCVDPFSITDYFHMIAPSTLFKSDTIQCTRTHIKW